MTWTAKQKKEYSKRMKEMWAAKRAVKALDREAKEIGRLIDETTGIPNLLRGNDPVNHPAHYTFSKYEVADVADEWYPTEPHLWQANKYLARWDKKGDPVENLEKAIWYIQRKINKLKEPKDG